MSLLMRLFKLPASSNGRLINFIRFSIYGFCFICISSAFSATDDMTPNQFPGPNSTQDSTSFSFIVWGHPRAANDADPPLHLDDLVNLVRELKPDFIVITGDMIRGRVGRVEEQKALLESDWDYFDECVKTLGVPIYRLPGNHDVSNTITSTIYSKRYPQPPYSFSYNGSRFVLLDSIGIKQRLNDSSLIWRYGYDTAPFDEEQINFIKNEISNQDKFKHLFFFMHHTSPWAKSESFWWDDVHPLLVNGNTRAVFTGDNPSYMKFAHIEQDGIHYLLNNTYPTRTMEHIKRWPKALLCDQRQMDNVQFVQVNGDKVKYKTHVIGELNTESLSWRYYEKADKALSTWQRDLIKKLQAKLFYSVKSIFFTLAGLGCVSFLLGILLTVFLKRNKDQRS